MSHEQRRRAPPIPAEAGRGRITQNDMLVSSIYSSSQSTTVLRRHLGLLPYHIDNPNPAVGSKRKADAEKPMVVSLIHGLTKSGAKHGSTETTSMRQTFSAGEPIDVEYFTRFKQNLLLLGAAPEDVSQCVLKCGLAHSPGNRTKGHMDGGRADGFKRVSKNLVIGKGGLGMWFKGRGVWMWLTMSELDTCTLQISQNGAVQLIFHGRDVVEGNRCVREAGRLQIEVRTGGLYSVQAGGTKKEWVAACSAD